MRATTHQARLERRAALLSLVVSVILLGAKFSAYLLTDSSAIFSDALESIVNVVAAALALYSIALAHAPADEGHPYGHGKVEFMSAAIEGSMMLVAAFVIVLHALAQLFRGSQLQESRIGAGMLLLAGAMAVNVLLGLYLLRAGRHGGSIALEADGKHLLADAITSAGVLAAVLLVKLSGWRAIDPIAAVLVAAYVALEAVHLLRRSTAGLMDEQDLADDRLLRDILASHAAPGGRHPRICSYHKLRHRHSGRYHWVDFHIMVPRHWDVDRGHKVASAIEHEIEQALREGDATAHVEPCAAATCPSCASGGSATRQET